MPATYNDRIWRFSFDNEYRPTSNADQTKYQLWALKAMLLGQLGGLVAPGLWSVYGSSDSVAAGNGDLVDRWGATYDPSKIVQAAAPNPHSWFALKSPSMNGVTFYLLISADSATTANATIIMAKTAFAGGTNIANPTSADSWTMATAGSAWNGGNSISVLNRFNMILSTTGDFIFFPKMCGQGGALGAGHPELVIAVLAPVGVDAGDTFPIFTYKFYQAASPGGLIPAQLYANNLSPVANRVAPAGGAGFCFVAGPAAAGSATVNSEMDILVGKFTALPAWLIANTAAVWHARGRLPDIACLVHNSAAGWPQAGLTVRDASRNVKYINIGMLLIPANAVPKFG